MRSETKKRDTRAEILDVAQDLIKRFGSNGISYQHISDAVAIRKPSIHHHFPTKNDLLLATIGREYDQFFLDLGEILDGPDSAAAKVRGYMKLFEKTFVAGRGAHICLFGMMGAELGGLDETVADRVRNFVRENVGALKVILERGRADRSIAFEGESEILATLIFSSLEGAMITIRAQGKEPESYGATIRQLNRLLGIQRAA